MLLPVASAIVDNRNCDSYTALVCSACSEHAHATSGQLQEEYHTPTQCRYYAELLVHGTGPSSHVGTPCSRYIWVVPNAASTQ